MKFRLNSLMLALVTLSASTFSHAEPAQQTATLYENVRVFNGTADKLTPPTNVLVVGNKIQTISGNAIKPPSDMAVTKIAGDGRTLMPGLIDAHTHLQFTGVHQDKVLGNPNPDVEYINKQILVAANEMLLRGFTAIRDTGGDVFKAKAAIDSGAAAGPRIYPSGTLICQTSGHCDFSEPEALPRSLGGQLTTLEKLRFSSIVDGRDQVLAAVRFNLRNGATQIKLATSGGGQSLTDPLYVDEFTFDEIKAAVQAAEDFGTYVTVHSYTPKAVRRSVDAGVKVVEHGMLLDEATVKYLGDRGIWLSTQVLDEAGPEFPADVRKRKHEIVEAQAKVWRWATKYNLKVGWGTDMLFEPENMPQQNSELAELKQFMSPARALKIATHDNAQLCALSGKRNPYPLPFGVVQEGAYADLLLVDGDPTVNLDIIADPQKNFRVIMKDGKIYKNTL